jgi:hypothetical protein
LLLSTYYTYYIRILIFQWSRNDYNCICFTAADKDNFELFRINCKKNYKQFLELFILSFLGFFCINYLAWNNRQKFTFTFISCSAFELILIFFLKLNFFFSRKLITNNLEKSLPVLMYVDYGWMTGKLFPQFFIRLRMRGSIAVCSKIEWLIVQKSIYLRILIATTIQIIIYKPTLLLSPN